jgi:hypothetical protein
MLTVCAHAIALSKQGDLHLIKKIYIEITPIVVEDRDIAPILKVELERRGFTIVDRVEAADASLTGEVTAEVYPHGGAPHKAIYRYQLTSSNQQAVWKVQVKFTTVLNFDEDNERAARKIAEKLLRAWQKSAKNAARK